MLNVKKLTCKNNIFTLYYYTKEGKVIKKFIPIRK